MKTYLVTGGAGFIGSNFIHYMLEKYNKEIKIINLDALTYAGNLENLAKIENNENYEFIQGDICDKELVAKIFTNNEIDFVVNFAAESHVDRSITDPEIFIKTNVLGTSVLLNVAKENWLIGDDVYKEGVKFLHVSTDEVYGSLGAEGYFTEKTPLDPNSPYSSSKASSDLIVKAYFETFKFPVNITRCSNNYGPYQFTEKLIPLMITNALEGKKLPIYGDGKNVRDWLYVEDHAKAIDIVINNGKLGEVYNIGGHNEKENVDIVNIIIDVVYNALDENDIRRKHINKDLIEYIQDRKGHDRRYAIDPTKISKELGWSPETMFSEGIVKTIKWYLENENWVENLKNK